VVVVLGVLAMGVAGQLAAPLGVRTALFISELFLVLPALAGLVILGMPLARALALRPIDRRTALASLGAGLALWAASLGVFELQYVLWRPPEGYLEAFRRLHEQLRPTGPMEAAYSVLAIAGAPAVCEELLFRGVVLGALRRPFGDTGAVFVSAMLFGIIHLDLATAGPPVLYRVPFAFVVGVGLGLLRLRSSSLLPAVYAHALLNTVTFSLAPWVDDPAQGLPDPRPFVGLALFAVGGGLFAVLLRVVRPVRR
jgi:membrane protease YdiL (CAAX protease family)